MKQPEFYAFSTPPSSVASLTYSQMARARSLRSLLYLGVLLGLCIWVVMPYIPFGRSVYGTASGISSARIAIVTFSTRQHSYTHLSLKNHAHYARLHGYDFLVDFEEHNTMGTMWHKFTMIERTIALEKYDWIWWMDFDTLITNCSTPVTGVIDHALDKAEQQEDKKGSDLDFIFTADCFPFNAGSFLVRSSPRVIPFFTVVRQHHAQHSNYTNQLSEQDCMRDVLKPGPLPYNVLAGHPLAGPFAKHATFVSQWMINAFPEEIPCVDDGKTYWEKGMLAIHFAGAWAHVNETERKGVTGRLMEKYIDLTVGCDGSLG